MKICFRLILIFTISLFVSHVFARSAGKSNSTDNLISVFNFSEENFSEQNPSNTNNLKNDRDGDGILDADDSCPDQKGPAITHGCPDSDNDGIADKYDACPNEPGPASLNGCPDRDNDGIADAEDACPDEKGTIQYKGCADTDNDGIADNVDACPDEKGISKFHGCAEVDSNDIAKINLLTNYIQFESGKDDFKPGSFSKMDYIVVIMKKNNSAKWEINVFESNSNSQTINPGLADKRAMAIKNYFIKNGVDKLKITSKGFTNTTPIKKDSSLKEISKEFRIEIKQSAE